VPLEFDSRSVVLAPRGGMWLKIVKRSDKWHLLNYVTSEGDVTLQ
jgi:hypothetical protein